MRVLVTGASGFLGSYIAEELSSRGHTVVALVRRTSNRKFLETLANVEFAEGAVEQPERVDAAVKGVDAIIHSAGLVKARSPEEFAQCNVVGTENMLAAARKNAAHIKRFVFISSLAAVGPSRDGKPVDPNQASPVTHYGRSKRAAEQAVIAAKDELAVTIIRPPLIYGPRDHETFAFFQSIARGVLPLLGKGDNTLSLVFASDAASAAVSAIDADVPSGSAYFVDDGTIHEWRTALETVEAAMGKRAFVRKGVPVPVVRIAAAASEMFGKLRNQAVMLTRDKVNELQEKHWVCDSASTRRDLNWAPKVDWREGVTRAATWYRENGWL